MNKMMMAGCAVATAFVAVAMPTKKELTLAQKPVEEATKADLVAFKAGRKTAKVVAESHVKLAEKAENQAEKYLFYQGAFKLYARSGEYDLAADAIEAMCRDVKDVSPEVIIELAGEELRYVADEKAPRLKAILAQTKRKASAGREKPLGVAKSLAVKDAYEGKTTIDGYTWSYRVKSGEAMIVDAANGRFSCAVSPSPIGTVTIPSMIDGVRVTSIGRGAFSNCRGMTSVTMPEGVTSIGMSAFYACSGIKSVDIPATVRNVDNLAFYNSGLTSVRIPEGTVSVGESAFGDCWGLESVTISSSVTSIGRQAFSSGSRLMSINVSQKNKMFSSVGGLLYTKDGKTLIAGVNGEVTIPLGVTSIGDSAFYKCGDLTSLAIPASVTKIGDSAFHWCHSMMTFSVSPENMAYSSRDGLLCSKDGKILIAGVNGHVVIPDGVVKIDKLAFSSRRGLTVVTIPATVKRIEAEAFRCCSGLTSVTICGEPPNCGKNIFSYCNGEFKIHVSDNSKNWAGMKTWQGIPLVFDVK